MYRHTPQLEVGLSHSDPLDTGFRNNRLLKFEIMSDQGLINSLLIELKLVTTLDNEWCSQGYKVIHVITYVAKKSTSPRTMPPYLPKSAAIRYKGSRN